MKFTPAEISETMSVLSQVDKVIREVTTPQANSVKKFTYECGSYLGAYISIHGIQFRKSSSGAMEIWNPTKFKIKH